MSDDISKAVQSSLARTIIGADADEALFHQAVTCLRQRCIKVSNQCKSDRHGKCRVRDLATKSEQACAKEFAAVAAKTATECGLNPKILGMAKRQIAARALEQRLDMNDPNVMAAMVEAEQQIFGNLVSQCVQATLERSPEYRRCTQLHRSARMMLEHALKNLVLEFFRHSPVHSQAHHCTAAVLTTALGSS